MYALLAGDNGGERGKWRSMTEGGLVRSMISGGSNNETNISV